MAAQTITTNTNFDTLTGLLAGETTTINNNARLTINSDPQINRVLMGDIAITEGECFVDGTTVRLLSFSTASVLPVVGDTLTSGAITGQVIGVSGTVTAGTVRLRSLSGPITNGAALTFTGGKTATAASADTVGWLRILGTETKGWITTRQGKLTIQGQWFELAVSTGAVSQVIQHYTTDAVPAIWVETGAGTGVYEIWLNAGGRWSASIGSGARGKFFGNANGSSAITFGDGNFGAIPPTGARIRVPNITISSALTTAPATGTINATAGSRYDLNTASSGEVSISKCSGAGFYINANQPYSINISDSGFLQQVAASEVTAACNLTNIGIGIFAANAAQSMVFSTLRSLVLTDCVAAAYGPVTNGAVLQMTDVQNAVVTRGTYTVFAKANSSHNGILLTRVSNGVMINVAMSGGFLDVQTCDTLTVTNFSYSDVVRGGSVTTFPSTAVNINNGSKNIKIDGFFVFDAGGLPRNSVVAIGVAGRVKVRNIGTATTPLDMANQIICLVQLTGNSSDIEIARCYGVNSVTSAKTDTNSVSGLAMLNVWSDTADVISNQSLNARYSGLRGGNNQIGAAGIAFALTSVYGAHFYDTFSSTTTGAIGLHMLEKTSIEPSASTYTINAGTPVFNSLGALRARTLGDQITWTCPWFVIGHTGFQNIAPVIGAGANLANHLIEYRLDTGAGFSGAFKTVNGANLSAETISSATGFRLQIRITVTATNATNSISGLFIPTITNATAQQELYPLDLMAATFALSGLIPGSEVRLFRRSDGVEIGGSESTGTTFSYLYTHFGVDIPIRFVVLNPGYVAVDAPVTLTAQSTTLPIQQRGDYSYA